MGKLEFWADGKKLNVVPCTIRTTGKVVEMENGRLLEEIEIVEEDTED